MEAPEIALQKAVYACLIANAGVKDAMGGTANVVDYADKDTAYPFVQIGRDQEIEDVADCIDGSEFYMTVDVWSVEPGLIECKRIAAAVRQALHHAPLDLVDHTLVALTRKGSRYLDGADGLAAHGVLTFHALTAPKT